MKLTPLLTCLTAAALALPAFGQVSYVDSTALGAGTGDSWDDAYTSLQAALANVTQGDIWVAAGTYHPGAPGDRLATFDLTNGVGVYGGFAGTETQLVQRDVAANPTILSGDIDDDDTYGAGANWWQFNWSGSAGNSYHVVTATGCDASTVLDGVTILAGVGSDPSLGGGGGLLVLGGGPTFRRCTFRYNAVGYGSSGYLLDCTSTFEDCVIRDGYTCNCGAGGWTSGLFCTGTSDVSFTNCDFINHYYVSSMGQGRGAALNIDVNSRATVVGCRFSENQTGNFFAIGGGTARGAGIAAHGDIVVDRCEFTDNFAHAGAGLTAWGNVTVTNSLFARNEAVSHSETSEISVGDYGAGMLTLGSTNDTIEITNSTFVDNNAEKGAGLAAYGNGTAVVRNTIIYDNYADPQPPGEDEVFILKQNLVGSYDVTYSCVEGLLQTEPGEDPPEPANFPGCLDTDPLLVDVNAHDYRLQATSPCIDAGDSQAIDPMWNHDLLGALRSFDDPATPDTGNGPAPIVDMGAYELGSPLPSAWTDLGQGLAGALGVPLLTGTGTLEPGEPMGLTLSAAAPLASLTLVVGFDALNAPAKGGILVPVPTILLGGFVTDAAGGYVISAAWPVGVPANTSFYFQQWVVDAGGPSGLAATNGLLGITP